MNNIKDLKFTLKTLHSVYRYDWNTCLLLIEQIQLNKAKILDSAWYDDYKNRNLNYYPLDLSKVKTWSTYNNSSCINLSFEIDDNTNKLVCGVQISNGDNMDGYFQNKRFKAKLELPDRFLLNIKREIESRLHYHMEDLYQQHLDKQKQDWIFAETLKLFNIKNDNEN